MIALTLVGLAYMYTEVETQDELRDVVSCVCFLGCFTTLVSIIYDGSRGVFSVINTGFLIISLRLQCGYYQQFYDDYECQCMLDEAISFGSWSYGGGDGNNSGD